MKRSAGLLLWRRGAGGALEVLLAHPGGPIFARRDDGFWSVPKGEVEPGEDEVAAARREFAEETGLPVPAGELLPLGEGVQSTGRKTNVVWALEGDLEAAAVRSNLFTMEWPPHSGRRQEFPEMDRAQWFPLPSARVKAFASQVVFLDRLEAHLAPP
jgi:predicted NUDIX family NTP pyrophosphohydrolase